MKEISLFLILLVTPVLLGAQESDTAPDPDMTSVHLDTLLKQAESDKRK